MGLYINLYTLRRSASHYTSKGHTCVSIVLNKAGKNLISCVNIKTQEIPTLMFYLDTLNPLGKNEGAATWRF